MTTVKCYSSWMTLGAISLDTVLASSVMGLAVGALSSPNSLPTLHEAASDCMISLLGRIEREDSGDLEQSTVTSVQQLSTSYQNAVAEEDMEKCLNYCSGSLFCLTCSRLNLEIYSSWGHQQGGHPHGGHAGKAGADVMALQPVA